MSKNLKYGDVLQISNQFEYPNPDTREVLPSGFVTDLKPSSASVRIKRIMK